MGDWNPKRLTVRHELIQDYMILNPAATRAEIAHEFEVSEQMISMLTTSDLFRHQLSVRRERMERRVEDTALARLQGKTARLAEVGVEKLTQAIEAGTADLDGIRATSEMALKMLGYGGGGPSRPSVVQTTQVVVVDAQTLADARARMRGESALKVIDAPSLPAA